MNWVIFHKAPCNPGELEERVNLRKQDLTRHATSMTTQKPRTSWADAQLDELKKLMFEIE